MLRPIYAIVFLALLGGITVPFMGSLVAQAQTPLPKFQPTRATYKQEFDKRTAFADQHCVMQPKQVKNLTYEICDMEDVLVKVTMDGPPGDNGPVAYFYSGRLYAYRPTGSGQAWIFQNGKLMAEVEVGDVAPAYNKIKTKFTAEERKANTDWAITSTRDMLKMFGRKLIL